MYTRQSLKTRAKIAFKANYWRCVLVALLASIASGSAFTINYNGNAGRLQNIQNGNVSGLISGFSQNQLLAIAGLAVGAAFLAVIIALAIGILVLNPLKVGTSSFFLENRISSNANISEIEAGFKRNYKNVVTVQFMKNLFTLLWTLLFIIPGVIKAYEYAFVSYLLTEDSDMDYNTALNTSSKLMYGHKWELFVLDLSFIGWFILGNITFGLVNFFYTMPYLEATHAEFYTALVHPDKMNAFINENGEREDVQTVEFTVEK